MKKLRVVEVEWVDSGAGGGWQFIANIDRQSLKCITVGFLLFDDDESISVASSIGLDSAGMANQAEGPITIPKVAIVRRRYVKDVSR